MPEGRRSHGPRRARVARAALALALGVLGAASPPAAPRRATAQEPAPADRAPKLARIEDFAPPESFVMAGGVKTHFVAKGTDGPCVVLIHGFGSSTYTWRQTIEALSGRCRVFALDMKGFGLTAKPKDGEYHPEAYARHVLGFLDAMKIDRAVLVGHSLGGAVAVRLALQHPDRVRGLVLVAAAPATWPGGGGGRVPLGDLVPGEKGEGPEPREKPRPEGRAGSRRLADRMLPALLRATMTPERVEAGLRGSFHDPKFVTREMVEVYHRPITIEGAAEALAAMMNPPPAAFERPLPPLEALDVPVLIAVGAHDKVVPRVVADQYARAWPRATRITFEDSGHMLHEEESERFRAALLEFLDRLPSAPRPAGPPEPGPTRPIP